MKFSKIVTFASALTLLATSISVAQNGNNGRQFKADYHLFDSADFDNVAGGMRDLHDFRAEVDIIKEKWGNFEVGIGLYYRFTKLEATGTPIVVDEDLHQIRVPIGITYRFDDSKWSAFLRLNPGISTDFDEIDGDDFIYETAYAGFGYRYSDNFTWFVGAFLTADFGEPRVYPGVGFTWNPGDDWTIALLPPRAAVTYHVSDSLKVSAIAEAQGGGWNIETAAGSNNLYHRVVKTGLEIQNEFSNGSSVVVGVGVGLFNNLTIDTTSDVEIFDQDLDAPLYFHIGYRGKF